MKNDPALNERVAKMQRWQQHWGIPLGILCAFYMFYSYFGDGKGLLTPVSTFRMTTGIIKTAHAHFGYRRSNNFATTYDYKVNGVHFTGQKVRFDLWAGSEPSDFVRKCAAHYVVGKSVTVYYLPNDPSFCVLEPDSDLKGEKGFLSSSFCLRLCSCSSKATFGITVS